MNINNRFFNLKRINFEITYRCNIKCSFCFLYHTKRLNKKLDEVSFEEIQDFIDTIDDKVEFYITGGEPFIRDDCIKIIKYIKDKSFNCGVNTNGILFTREKIERLVATDLDYIIFSLHGPYKIQDAISGVKGSYRRIVHNIEYFLNKRHNTEVIITCTINPLNISYLDKVYLLGKNLGVDRVIFEHLQFIRKYELRKHIICWKKIFSKKNNIITPYFDTPEPIDTNLLHRKIESIKSINNKRTHFEIRPLLSLQGLDKWYNKNIIPLGYCDSIWKTMVIAPNGDIRICQLYSHKLGNIMKDNYRKIWLNKKFNIFRKETLRRGKLLPGCVRCCQRFRIFRYN